MVYYGGCVGRSGVENGLEGEGIKCHAIKL